MAATAKDVAGTSSEKPTCSLPYGAPPNIHDASGCTTRVKEPKPVDRIAHAEARTLSFLAENLLPISLAPLLVNYAKEMAKDVKALDGVSLERTSATYKLKEGLGTLSHKRLVNDMQTHPFSINTDECVNTSNDKVYSILVSYFSEDIGETVVKHYRSVTLTRVTAKILHDCVINALKEDEIPWKLLSPVCLTLPTI